MFRAANQRRNLVIEAEVSVTLVLDIVTLEGETLRRFHDLKVSRSRTPLFFLTWQIMHPITLESPLHGETAESLLEKRAEILVIVRGLDETFVQTIQARTGLLSKGSVAELVDDGHAARARYDGFWRYDIAGIMVGEDNWRDALAAAGRAGGVIRSAPPGPGNPG